MRTYIGSADLARKHYSGQLGIINAKKRLILPFRVRSALLQRFNYFKALRVPPCTYAMIRYRQDHRFYELTLPGTKSLDLYGGMTIIP